ncbi:MAG: ATP-binding protein [Pseudomonadota bacterium]
MMPPRRAPSLLARLFLRIGALFMAVVALIAGATFLVARHSVNEMYDDQLVVGARVLRFLMSDELKAAEHAPPAADAHEHRAMPPGERALLSSEDRRAFGSYAEWRMFRVWVGGRLAMQSGIGPPESAPPTAAGFRDLNHAGVDWRIYVLTAPEHALTVEVGERSGIRRDLLAAVMLSLAGPLLLLAALAAWLIWAALRDGLHVLRALLDEIGRRSPRDLSPVGFRAWPRDLYPLIRAINGLLDRVAGSLQHERRFLDDAAHQLRTPLAGVKLQAQMIAQEPDAAERRVLIAGLLASVDRASTLTDDLLTLARLDAGDVAASTEVGDLQAETAAAIADLAPLAASRDVALSFEGPGALAGGDPVLLRLVAANLIENAIHHAPARSEVEVRLSRTPDGRRLVVTDNGPGIPDAGERARVMQRFQRGRDGGGAGSGLGLSIVVAALDFLGGRLRLEPRADGLGGLQVTADLPDEARAA